MASADGSKLVVSEGKKVAVIIDLPTPKIVTIFPIIVATLELLDE